MPRLLIRILKWQRLFGQRRCWVEIKRFLFSFFRILIVPIAYCFDNFGFVSMLWFRAVRTFLKERSSGRFRILLQKFFRFYLVSQHSHLLPHLAFLPDFFVFEAFLHWFNWHSRSWVSSMKSHSILLLQFFKNELIALLFDILVKLRIFAFLNYLKGIFRTLLRLLISFINVTWSTWRSLWSWRILELFIRLLDFGNL